MNENQRVIYRKIKRILALPINTLRISKVISKPSYYPELPRKSRSEMWFDNFKWLIRYKELLPFYTSYGLDVKGFRNPDDFIATTDFPVPGPPDTITTLFSPLFTGLVAFRTAISTNFFTVS